MLTDMFIALIIAASFGIGAFLYHLTSEEIDSFRKKFRFKLMAKVKAITLLILTAILGAGQAFTAKTLYKESASILILAIALVFGSFVVAEKDQRLTLKYAAETIITFFVFFVIIFILLK